MEERILSIYIPTYNRKERLLNQLNSILIQPLSKSVDIVVIDNHSNYDVKAAIVSNWDETILERVQIKTNPYNVGLSLNISLPFFYCKSKWLWIVSDDDETTLDSLEIVMEDIKKYSDYLVLKYSLGEASRHHNDIINSLNELTDYYDKKEQFKGEFIFLSNGIYNIEKLKPVLGDCISYSHNAIAGANPILYGLDKKLGSCIFLEREVVKYLPPKPGSEWSLQHISTRFANIVDYPFSEDGETIKKVMGMVDYFGLSPFMTVCEAINDRKKVLLYHHKVFHTVICHGSLFKRLACNLVFWTFYITKLNVINFFKKNKIAYEFFKKYK